MNERIKILQYKQKFYADILANAMLLNINNIKCMTEVSSNMSLAFLEEASIKKELDIEDKMPDINFKVER